VVGAIILLLIWRAYTHRHGSSRLSY